jgi:hypothetical protein
MPLAKTDAGRSLPRAYVARRRSSPSSVRRIDATLRDDRAAGMTPVASPEPSTDEWKRWAVVGTLGLIIGLIAAWLFRVVR